MVFQLSANAQLVDVISGFSYAVVYLYLMLAINAATAAVSIQAGYYFHVFFWSIVYELLIDLSAAGKCRVGGFDQRVRLP